MYAKLRATVRAFILLYGGQPRWKVHLVACMLVSLSTVGHSLVKQLHHKDLKSKTKDCVYTHLRARWGTGSPLGAQLWWQEQSLSSGLWSPNRTVKQSLTSTLNFHLILIFCLLNKSLNNLYLIKKKKHHTGEVQ